MKGRGRRDPEREEGEAKTEEPVRVWTLETIRIQDKGERKEDAGRERCALVPGKGFSRY